MAELDLTLQRLWEEHLTGLQAVSVQAAQARSELDEARSTVERLTAAVAALRPPDDAALSRRRVGEVDQPESLVRARRGREHERTVREARALLDTAQNRVRSLQARLVDLGSREAEALRTTVERARTEVRLALVRRAVYDHALLARHPQGHLVAGLLDRSEPSLPDWAGTDADSGIGRAA
jgi:chromosome segregation ATPase